MKYTRRIAFILLFCWLCSLTATAGTAIVEPTEAFYVADYADILSEETEAYLCQQNAALEASCGGQIVVITISFLNDLDSEQYAYQVLNQWQVGDSDKNNGTVLLLVPGEEKFWMTVGYGIESYFSSSSINQILDLYLADDFDLGNYDDAVVNTINAVIHKYDQFYNVSTGETGYTGTEYEDYNTYYETSDFSRRTVMDFLFRIVVFLVVAYLIYRLLHNSNNRRYDSDNRRNHYIFFGMPGSRRPPRGHRPPPPPVDRGPRPNHFGGSRPDHRPGGSMNRGSRPGGSWGSSSRPASRPSGGMGRGGGGAGHGGGGGRR